MRRQRRGHARFWYGLGVVSLLGHAGCDNEEVKRCHAQMAGSQQVLLDMDKTDVGSVSRTLQAIDATLSVCEAAGRPEEAADIRSAKRQVEAHLAALQERQNRPEEAELSPEQLAKLVDEGDSTCPRGQGYEHGASKKLIRCTGPRLIEMTRPQARQYFEKRGYNVSFDEKEAELTAEYGATRYRLEFAEASEHAKQKCTEVTAPPGIPWQETAARLTAVHPSKIERGKPLQLPSGPVDFMVEGEGQFTIYLGECGSSSAK